MREMYILQNNKPKGNDNNKFSSLQGLCLGGFGNCLCSVFGRCCNYESRKTNEKLWSYGQDQMNEELNIIFMLKKVRKLNAIVSVLVGDNEKFI